MWLERISGGDDELVSRDAVKTYLRILSDEAEVVAEIDAATKAASAHLNVDDDGFGGLGFPLVAQVWSSKSASFCEDVLRLPFGRVSAITAINYYDESGVQQVVPSGSYMLARRGRTSVVVLLDGFSWPKTAKRPDAVDVRFSAGYETVADLPSDLVDALLLLASFRYHNRGVDLVKGLSEDVERTVESLTGRYRRYAG